MPSSVPDLLNFSDDDFELVPRPSMDSESQEGRDFDVLSLADSAVLSSDSETESRPDSPTRVASAVIEALEDFHYDQLSKDAILEAMSSVSMPRQDSAVPSAQTAVPEAVPSEEHQVPAVEDLVTPEANSESTVDAVVSPASAATIEDAATASAGTAACMYFASIGKVVIPLAIAYVATITCIIITLVVLLACGVIPTSPRYSHYFFEVDATSAHDDLYIPPRFTYTYNASYAQRGWPYGCLHTSTELAIIAVNSSSQHYGSSQDSAAAAAVATCPVRLAQQKASGADDSRETMPAAVNPLLACPLCKGDKVMNASGVASVPAALKGAAAATAVPGTPSPYNPLLRCPVCWETVPVHVNSTGVTRPVANPWHRTAAKAAHASAAANQRPYSIQLSLQPQDLMTCQASGAAAAAAVSNVTAAAGDAAGPAGLGGAESSWNPLLSCPLCFAGVRSNATELPSLRAKISRSVNRFKAFMGFRAAYIGNDVHGLEGCQVAACNISAASAGPASAEAVVTWNPMLVCPRCWNAVQRNVTGAPAAAGPAAKPASNASAWSLFRAYRPKRFGKPAAPSAFAAPTPAPVPAVPTDLAVRAVSGSPHKALMIVADDEQVDAANSWAVFRSYRTKHFGQPAIPQQHTAAAAESTVTGPAAGASHGKALMVVADDESADAWALFRTYKPMRFERPSIAKADAAVNGVPTRAAGAASAQESLSAEDTEAVTAKPFQSINAWELLESYRLQRLGEPAIPQATAVAAGITEALAALKPSTVQPIEQRSGSVNATTGGCALQYVNSWLAADIYERALRLSRPLAQDVLHSNLTGIHAASKRPSHSGDAWALFKAYRPKRIRQPTLEQPTAAANSPTAVPAAAPGEFRWPDKPKYSNSTAVVAVSKYPMLTAADVYERAVLLSGRLHKLPVLHRNKTGTMSGSKSKPDSRVGACTLPEAHNPKHFEQPTVSKTIADAIVGNKTAMVATAPNVQKASWGLQNPAGSNSAGTDEADIKRVDRADSWALFRTFRPKSTRSAAAAQMNSSTGPAVTPDQPAALATQYTNSTALQWLFEYVWRCQQLPSVGSDDAPDWVSLTAAESVAVSGGHAGDMMRKARPSNSTAANWLLQYLWPCKAVKERQLSERDVVQMFAAGPNRKQHAEYSLDDFRPTVGEQMPQQVQQQHTYNNQSSHKTAKLSRCPLFRAPNESLPLSGPGGVASAAAAAVAAVVRRITQPIKPIPALYIPAPPCLLVQSDKPTVKVDNSTAANPKVPSSSPAQCSLGSESDQLRSSVLMLGDKAASVSDGLTLPMLPPLVYAPPPAAAARLVAAAAAVAGMTAAAAAGLTLPMLPPICTTQQQLWQQGEWVCNGAQTVSSSGGLTLPMLPPITCSSCSKELQLVQHHSSSSSKGIAAWTQPANPQQQQPKQQQPVRAAAAPPLQLPEWAVAAVAAAVHAKHASTNSSSSNSSSSSSKGVSCNSWVSTWATLPMLPPKESSASSAAAAAGVANTQPAKSQQPAAATTSGYPAAAPAITKRPVDVYYTHKMDKSLGHMQQSLNALLQLLATARARSFQCNIPSADPPATVQPFATANSVSGSNRKQQPAFVPIDAASTAAKQLFSLSKQLQTALLNQPNSVAGPAPNGADVLQDICAAVSQAHRDVQIKLATAVFKAHSGQKSLAANRAGDKLPTAVTESSAAAPFWTAINSNQLFAVGSSSSNVHAAAVAHPAPAQHAAAAASDKTAAHGGLVWTHNLGWDHRSAVVAAKAAGALSKAESKLQEACKHVTQGAAHRLEVRLGAKGFRFERVSGSKGNGKDEYILGHARVKNYPFSYKTMEARMF